MFSIILVVLTLSNLETMKIKINKNKNNYEYIQTSNLR